MRIITIVFFTLISCATLKGQTISRTDSMEIKSKIEGFYSWYVDLIKNNKENSEFNPSFVKGKDKMTTLDFTKYTNGLRKHHFTQEFIERKVSEYQPCINNLKKIPYDTFNTYTDLDQFESINCAFSNVYEWSGGMEPIDEAKLVNLKPLKQDKAEARIKFFMNTPTERISSGGRTFLFTKSKSGWKIDGMNN